MKFDGKMCVFIVFIVPFPLVKNLVTPANIWLLSKSSPVLQFRTISKIKPILSHPDLVKVIHTQVFSRLNKCNSLLSGISQKSLSSLQLVQNITAWFLTGLKRPYHITPIPSYLHWLPVSFRIDYMILLITFKACRGLAPSYNITELLTTYVPSCSLRSSGRALLAVPRVEN